MRFTDKALQALKARKTRYEVVEDGGSGLTIRVSPRGVKTFCYLYRFDGKPRRLVLGRYRDAALEPLGKPSDRDGRGLLYLTLADARVKLAEARKLRDGGIDPSTPALEQRQRERKASTVSDLIDDFLEKYAERHKKASSAAEDKRQLKKDVKPAWGDRKATSITRHDVVELLDAVVARGSPVAANRLLAVIRKMFKWVVKRGVLHANPAADIDRPGGKEASRERILTDDEIAEVWAASAGLPKPYGPFVKLLLVLGQRRGETAGMRRSELDMTAKLWTIPAARTKNGLAHEVPLPPMALGIIEPILGKMSAKEDCLFKSGRKGDAPLAEFKNAKRKLDAAIIKARKERALEAGTDPEEVAPPPHWTLHDLRRTMRTNLSRLRLDPEICERVINHVPAGVRRVYDLHQFRDEKREVLNGWATRLKRIVSTKPATGGKVVRLHQERSA